MAKWQVGDCIFNCDVNPADLKVGILEKKPNKQVKYPRIFFIRLEHIPTGISVTKFDKSQLLALDRCLTELDILVNEYESSQI